MAVSNPPAPATLPEVLQRQPRGREAVLFEGRWHTYGELHDASCAAASVAWHQWGVRPGDRVAWLGANHVEQLTLLFALARIGAILLPLNFRLAPAEWQQLLAECSPGHLVCGPGWQEQAQDLAERCSIVAHPWTELQGSKDIPAAPNQASIAAPVLIVHTSGTTGGPKGAVHTQANLLANMAIASSVQTITPADTVLTVLPLFHVGGLCIQTLPALHAGARVILHARFGADDALTCIATDRPTLTLQVPATMKALIEHPLWARSDLSSLRALWAGSSMLPAPLIHAFHERSVPVCNVYGATETGPFSIALGPEHARDKVGSCGWPAPGVEVRAGTAHGDAVELLVRGPNVVQSYWPDAPAVDAQGWFATGDLGEQDGDGSWRIVGRARDLIISGGENIHPAEIEQALALHPAVAECAAFPLADDRWGELVAVAVVLQPNTRATEADLLAHLQQRLARFKLPRRWVFVPQLPKTALGKVQRGLLAKELS